MRKILFIVCLSLLILPAIAEDYHVAGCSGDHNKEILMTDELIEVKFADYPFEWELDDWVFYLNEVTKQIDFCRGEADGREIVVFPDKVFYRGHTYRISTAKQHEGGYPGIVDFVNEGNPSTILIIPDSYTSIDFIGWNATLEYVSLPANDLSYKMGLNAKSLFNGLDVIWLVVEGSSAHQGLVDAGINNYLFRQEYCHYCSINENHMIFSPELFAKDIPSLEGPNQNLEAQETEAESLSSTVMGHTLSITEADLIIPPPAFAFVDGIKWGVADEKGNVMTDSSYDQIDSIGHGLFITYLNDKKGLYSVWGEILDTEWDEIDLVGLETLLLRKDSIYAVLNLPDGIIYQINGPDPFIDGKLILYLVPPTREDPFNYGSGLYDNRGNILWPAASGNDFRMFDDGRIGISTDGKNGMPYAVLLNPDGSIRYEETKTPSYWWYTGVPVLVKKDRYEVFFDHGFMAFEKPDELYGVVEGWRTKDNKFFTIAEARYLGFSSPDQTYEYACFFHRDGTKDRSFMRHWESAMPLFLNPHHYTIPITVRNGYAIVYGQEGFPAYYMSGNLTYSSSDRHNDMIARMERISRNRINYSSMTLALASQDGIGSGELFDMEGRRYFFWFEIEDRSSEAKVLEETSEGLPVAMSLFNDKSAIIYSSDGKAGLIDLNGHEQLPMIYDRIENYNGYALAFTASSVENQSFLQALINFNNISEGEYSNVISRLIYAKGQGNGIMEYGINPDRPIHSGETWLYNKLTKTKIRLVLPNK